MAKHIKRTNRGKLSTKTKYDLGGLLRNASPVVPNIGMNLSKVGLSQVAPAAIGGGGFPGLGGLASGIAGIGSGFIDMFANPDDINLDRYSNINEGAAAGKGALTGAAKGAAAGMALGPIGGLIGGAIGGITGGLFGKAKAEKEEATLNKAYEGRLKNSRTQSRLMNTPEAPTYLPVAKQGGYTVYNGETHKGPNGGILTDEFGNPTGLSQGTPIALTENKEVARYDPHTGSTYIYSDSLGFAKPANDLVNKYKLNKSNSLLYKQYKNDSLLQPAIDKQFENLTTAQEFTKGTDTKSEESLEMAKGGYLSKAKAKEMLKDGTAHGKKLTARQKRYFGWVAGGKKEDGGPLTTGEVKTPLPQGATPIYAREFDNPVNLANEAYLFEPNTPASNNYFYPENILSKAKNTTALPTFTGKRGFDVGYVPYTDRTDLPPAGGYTINNSDTTFYRREPEMLPNNKTVYNYNKSNRKGINESMNLVTTGSFNSDPTQSARYAGIAEYYKAIGQPIPKSFKKGGSLPKYDGTDPWPSYLDVRARNAASAKLAEEQLKEFRFYKGNIQDTYDILLPNTPSNPFPGNPYRPTPEEQPLEIPAGKPIVRETPITTPTGVGSGRKPRSLDLLLLNTQWDAYNVNTPRVASPLDSSRLATRPTSTTATSSNTTTDSEYYNPILNPAGHLLSAAGNLADYFAMKKAKPTDVRLPRVGAERIDLSRQRLMNERNAGAARATNVATARGLGTNAGSTFSNIAASNTGVSRLLGEQNMQSLLAEESANAQMQQQANMVNAQMGAEEALTNTRQQNAYRAAMARMNPMGNMARTAASYFADNSAYGQGYDTLRMLAPNAELYGDGNTFLDRLTKRPNVRLRDK